VYRCSCPASGLGKGFSFIAARYLGARASGISYVARLDALRYVAEGAGDRVPVLAALEPPRG
jgi:hypothetical protein